MGNTCCMQKDDGERRVVIHAWAEADMEAYRPRKSFRRAIGVGHTYMLWWNCDKMETESRYDWIYKDVKEYSHEELWKTRHIPITHMKIDGRVPTNLHILAPGVTHISMQKLTLRTAGIASLSLLTNLEMLDISGNDFSSEELPDVLFSLTTLRELDLSYCNLYQQRLRLSRLPKLEVLDLSGNGMPSISSIGFPKLLKELRLSRCKIYNLPESLAQLTQLEVLDLSNNTFDPSQLHDLIFSHLTMLKELHLRNCELFSLSGRITQLGRLEVLDLAKNDILIGVEKVFMLKSLRKLNLSECGRNSLPTSIMLETQIEVLHLSKNDFTPQALRTIFFYLPSLRELYMSNCGLESLPESIFAPTHLEVLDLSNNSFSMDGLPDMFHCLTSLKKLYLVNCGLYLLPASISELSELEVLDLSHNDLSFEGLPDMFFTLQSLKRLYLVSCVLDILPESISCLEKLEILDIEGNRFLQLPPPVCKLKMLRQLNLKGSSHLATLDSRLLEMGMLEQINTLDCSALESPPYGVCQQGIDAIRQYYIDLAKGAGKKVPSATIAVIGQALAGKTSIVKTLQNKLRTRILTYRGAEAAKDESTKVFNFEEVDVGGSVLRFIDMGGHEVYHLTYQLTLRQNCIPVIVVSVEQYKQLARTAGDREAVRRLFLDWISHLYLAQPDLGSPRLIITHKDKCSQEEYLALKSQYLATTDSLRNEIVREEKELQKEIFCKIKHLSNPNEPMFSPKNIYEVGNDPIDYAVFDTIKMSLDDASQQYVTLVPQLWEDVDEMIQLLPGCFRLFDELFELLQKTHQIERQQLEIILTYMHNCGKLLWYKNIESLSCYVFHNIPTVTQLLNVLYDHNVNVWQERKERFQTTAIGPKRHEMDAVEYNELVNRFNMTGVMHEMLLLYLLKSESEFRTDHKQEVAISILRSFRLIHGPLSRENEVIYVVPYFADGYLSAPMLNEKDLTFRVEIMFKGLALPQYVYNQMTVGLLELFPSERDTPIVKENGASVYHGGSVISIIHDFRSRMATIWFSTNVENIAKAWKELIKITNNTIAHVLETWSASRLVCVFYCPHCLLRGEVHPQRTVNPSWCRLSETRQDSNRRVEMHTRVETVVCGEHKDVPSPLKFQCTELPQSDMEQLKNYVIELRQDNGSQLPKQATQRPNIIGPCNNPVDDDADSDISDGGGYLYPYDNPRKTYIKPRLSCTEKQRIVDLSTDSSQVYRMSSPIRGRALIINNKDVGEFPRHGSEIDVDNMRVMLEQFRFEISSHSNLTAEGMLTAIIRETEHPHHEDYGMFVLVIMSHGTDNDCIYGVDYPNTVKLIDVYDSLSTQSFSHMAGKPKLIIVQACCGVRKDLGNIRNGQPDEPAIPEPAVVTKLDANAMEQTAAAPPHNGPSGNHEAAKVATSKDEICQRPLQYLNVDDMLVVKSSFESYSSIRHHELGSLFIRCLVTTFYKHACHRDVWTLCEIIQKRVREETMKLARISPDHGFGQVPVYIKTFTNFRKLYLFPGI